MPILKQASGLDLTETNGELSSLDYTMSIYRVLPFHHDSQAQSSLDLAHDLFDNLRWRLFNCLDDENIVLVFR